MDHTSAYKATATGLDLKTLWIFLQSEVGTAQRAFEGSIYQTPTEPYPLEEMILHVERIQETLTNIIHTHQAMGVDKANEIRLSRVDV